MGLRIDQASIDTVVRGHSRSLVARRCDGWPCRDGQCRPPDLWSALLRSPTCMDRMYRIQSVPSNLKDTFSLAR